MMQNLHTLARRAPLGAAVCLACVSAWAGFIDERKAPPAAEQVPRQAAPSAAGFDVANPSTAWDERAVVPAQQTSIVGVVSRVMPPGSIPAVIDADESLVDLMVSVPQGLTRRQVMEWMAQQHNLRIVVKGSAVRVASAATPAGAAGAALGRDAAAQAASAKHEHVQAAAGPVVAASAPTPPASAAAGIEPAPARALPIYSATPADVNMRRLLRRWAQESGWTFDDQHWTLGRDIPLVASITLGSDFKAAVRTVLDSTEFTSTPARACFYSNQVLRVVPRTEQCNRSGA